MKKKLLKIVGYNVLSAAVLLGAGTAMGDDRGQLSSSDYRFIKKADEANMAEVQMAQIAKNRAGDPAIKDFADRMERDHTAANQKLAQLAQDKGATLPSELTATDRRETDHLMKLSGPEFDRVYMERMVREHKADVKEFERESRNAADPAVQTWASTTLPTLQDHLRSAESIEAQVKSGAVR